MAKALVRAANCFEALMGAIFLDGGTTGINLADTVFAEAMFGAENDLWETWKDLAPQRRVLLRPSDPFFAVRNALGMILHGDGVALFHQFDLPARCLRYTVEAILDAIEQQVAKAGVRERGLGLPHATAVAALRLV